MLSVFMPTVKFARLLLVLLSVALVGDLLLLPAILASPFGRLFRAKQVEKKVTGRVTDPSEKATENSGENPNQNVQDTRVGPPPNSV